MSSPTPKPLIRLDEVERDLLKKLGFTHVVYIAKDVSVVVPGAIEGAFRHAGDADAFAKKLSTDYCVEDSFAVEAL